MENEVIKFITVLRSGGDFKPEHVDPIYKEVVCQAEGLGVDVAFICLTDIHDGTVPNDEPLLYNFPGWWSKLEAFRITGPCIYMDLDTVIINSLKPLFTAVLENCGGDEIYMLKAWHRDRVWASGVVAWNGNWSKVLDSFDEVTDLVKYKSVQLFTVDQLHRYRAAIKPIQSVLNVSSYKNDVLKGKTGHDIVCFHGKPRPWDVPDLMEVL